jgi:hypothetical protein
MRTGEMIVTGGFVLVGAYVLYEIATTFVSLGIASGGGRDNAALFPGILAGLLLVVSGLHIGGRLINKSRSENEDRSRSLVDVVEYTKAAGSGRLQLALVGLLVGYIVLLDFVGYIVTTPIALMAMFRLLGVRKTGANLIVSLVTTILVWLVFSELMRIPMPPGRFGLYL